MKWTDGTGTTPAIRINSRSVTEELRYMLVHSADIIIPSIHDTEAELS